MRRTQTLRDRLQQRDDSGEDGYILVSLGLLLIPLMIFAALAVDVGSFYARTTQLQKAADSAALAAVVWMPDTTKANSVANASLASNGFVNGTGNIVITLRPGSNGPNTYAVDITDSTAKTYFAKVFTNAPISLTRSSEATYNTPLALGSPLNFFGGYQKQYPPTTTTVATGTETHFYPPSGNINNGESTPRTTIPDPDTVKCNISSSYYPTFLESPTYGGTQYRSYSSTGTLSTAIQTAPAPVCQWTTTTYTTVTTPSPIRSEQNPKFWAAIEAPGTNAVQGDRYSPWCYGAGMCSSVTNPSHRVDAAGRSGGYLYSIVVPNPAPAYIVVQAFDAVFTNKGQTVGTGDSSFHSGDWNTQFQMRNNDASPLTPDNNPNMTGAQCGDGTVNSTGSAASNTEGSGFWDLPSDGSFNSTFLDKWATLCVISAPVAGGTYYLEVSSTPSSSGSLGDASNNYALRAVAATSGVVGDVDSTGYPNTGLATGNALQPTLAAYSDMSMYNNIDNSGGLTDTGTFYLAKIGSQYAGKTVDVLLYDSGDGSGISLTVNDDVGAHMGCTYSSAPLGTSSSSGLYPGEGGSISASVAKTVIPTTSPCTISTSGVYNGTLLTIKIPIPSTYTCNAALAGNPLQCWWSVTYNATTAHDNTTWSAKIEGDPVHLSE